MQYFAVIERDRVKFFEYLQSATQRYDAVIVDDEYESPLKDALYAVKPGNPGFINAIKERFVEGRKTDKDLPALRMLQSKSTMEHIFSIVESEFEKDSTITRKIKMYLCQRFSGECLKNIGS